MLEMLLLVLLLIKHFIMQYIQFNIYYTVTAALLCQKSELIC